MIQTIWIFSIEPVETRYTIEWHKHFPELLRNHLGDKFLIHQIDGDTLPGKLENGEFLDFVSTNLWKNEQANKFFKYVKSGHVQKGDQIIFMDAWNPVITQIKYVNDLRKMDWTLHGLWHAGSYDPQDFLGRLVGNDLWVRHAEKSFFNAIDHNYFATYFHSKMFVRELLNNGHDDLIYNFDLDANLSSGKMILTGWPFEYLAQNITRRLSYQKEDIILFPHRLAPEKNLEIFVDLANSLPQYDWIVCQSEDRTKEEYHELLMKSKMIFSANLQETLGISTCAEGPLAGALPLTPDRLSYSEVFHDHPIFLYPSEWTSSWNNYINYKSSLMLKIVGMMEYHDEYTDDLKDYLTQGKFDNYFTANALIEQLSKNK